MKTLIIILTLSAFLQTSILPINLVLLILICRAYIKSDNANLYLAFAFGLLVALLSLNNLGLESITYLIIILATQILSKSRLTGNPLLIVPVAFAFLSLNQIVSVYITHQIFQLPLVILASLLALPVFYFLKLWEERFIVRKGIKLRV